MSKLLCAFSVLYTLNHQIVGTFVSDQKSCLRGHIQNKCPNTNVTFWLYNKHVDDYQLDETKISTITKAPFIAHVKTVLILHGYTKSKSEEPNIWLRPEYQKLDYNIISADYSRAVRDPCYAEAVANTDTIAKCVAHFIETILTKTNVTLNKLLVIGFSLGGQVGGRISRYLNTTHIRLPRLVGLDVAAPYFYGTRTYITKASAEFVIGIHTNSLFSGKMLPVSHIDFFVNYGVVQSPCMHKVNIDNITDIMMCSHDMAPQYYAESINSQKYFCGKTSSKQRVVMGEYTPDGSRGVYFVKTNTKPPYARDESC